MNKDKLPKFLMVNNVPEQRTWNKYLLKPFHQGEIVKVASCEEQQAEADWCSSQLSLNIDFSKKFIVVYRQDDNGKFTLRYVQDLSCFCSLQRKS